MRNETPLKLGRSPLWIPGAPAEQPRAPKTSDNAQTSPTMTLNGTPIDPETMQLAPDRSRNARVAITLALRARNESRRVRTLERLERRYEG
jgi:hypothetical protein